MIREIPPPPSPSQVCSLCESGGNLSECWGSQWTPLFFFYGPTTAAYMYTTQLVFDRVSSGANLDSITHCSELGKNIKASLCCELFDKARTERSFLSSQNCFQTDATQRTVL